MSGDDLQLRSGSMVRIDAAASVQFALAPFDARIIRVQDWTTCEGWVWLDVYQLDAAGNAIERRSVFVRRAGLTRTPPH